MVWAHFYITVWLIGRLCDMFAIVEEKITIGSLSDDETD